MRFYHALRVAVGINGILCTKVALTDLFQIQVKSKEEYLMHFRQLDRKWVDYLVCDPLTMRPRVAVDLYDPNDQRPERQARNEFVESVFNAAGFPLICFPANSAFTVEQIQQWFAPYLTPDPAEKFRHEQQNVASVTQPTTPLTPDVSRRRIRPQPTAESLVTEPGRPHCPECGRQMLLRTVRHGTNAGVQLWSCCEYPTCSGTRPYNA